MHNRFFVWSLKPISFCISETQILNLTSFPFAQSASNLRFSAGQELDLVILNMFFNQASSSYANFLNNLMLSSSATPTKNYNPLSNACTTTYQILISEVCYNVTFTWVKTWTGHSLTLKIQSLCDEDEYECEISLQSYLFKSNKGRKSFRVGKRDLSLFWDMRSATHSGNPQPCSSYYIALVSNSEIVLLLGDLDNKAVNDTQSIPSSNEARIIYTTQNVYGKNEFSTKITLAQEHNIFIKTSLLNDLTAPQMWISVDGAPMVQVTNLNWRFRGNETVVLNNMKLNIMWDVHDWLFNAHGLGQGLFIFAPSLGAGNDPRDKECRIGALSEHQQAPDSCYFVYAWKTD